MSEQIKLRAGEESYEQDPEIAHILGVIVNERYSEVQTGKKPQVELTKNAYDILPLVESIKPRRRKKSIILKVTPGVRTAEIPGKTREYDPSPPKVMDATRAIDPVTGESETGWTIDRSSL